MPLTEKDFLDYELKAGIGFHNPKFINLARKTVAQVMKYKNLKTLDFGCGTAVYSEEFRKAGFDITAQDIYKAHRDYAKENAPDLKVVARPIKAEFLIFVEVAEHMTDEDIYTAIEKIQPNVILFSSTSEKTDFDVEWNHINIKEQSEWIEFWKGLGFRKIQDLKLPTKWTMLLERI